MMELSVLKCPTYDGLYIVSLTMNMLELWVLPGQLTTPVKNCDGFSNLLLEEKRRIISLENWKLTTELRRTYYLIKNDG